MRTVQRTYTLFDIEELEETARQKAYTDWLAKGNDYLYASENCNTLEAFCNLFRIVCTNYRYDSCTYYYRFYTEQEEDMEGLSGIRLRTFICNNFHYGLYYLSQDLLDERLEEEAEQPHFPHFLMPSDGLCHGRHHVAAPHGISATSRQSEFQGTHA